MGNAIGSRVGYEDISNEKSQIETLSTDSKTNNDIPRYICEGYGSDVIDEETYQREQKEIKEKREKAREEQERLKIEGMNRENTPLRSVISTPKIDKKVTPLVITYNKPIETDNSYQNPIIIKKKQTKSPKSNILSYKKIDDLYILEGETFSVKDLIKQIPGKKWNKEEGFWSVPFNDISKRMLDIIIEKQKAKQ